MEADKNADFLVASYRKCLPFRNSILKNLCKKLFLKVYPDRGLNQFLVIRYTLFVFRWSRTFFIQRTCLADFNSAVVKRRVAAETRLPVRLHILSCILGSLIPLESV